MKHKFLLFFLLPVSLTFFLTGCVSWQDKGETDVFQKVIEFENMDADTLFDKALIWCKKEFRSSESNQNSSAIDYSDKNEHIISGTYITSENYMWKTFTWVVNAQKYSFTAETREGRIRVTMQLLEARLNGGWIAAGEGHQKHAKSSELFEKLTKSLESEIKGISQNNDW